jgi:hypothetical protein
MRFEREGGRRHKTNGVDEYLAPEKKNIRNQNRRNLAAVKHIGKNVSGVQSDVSNLG